MKKMIATTLIFSALAITLAAAPGVVYAHCGTCGVEAEHKCEHKHWYNPLSWFKKCDTCMAKQG